MTTRWVRAEWPAKFHSDAVEYMESAGLTARPEGATGTFRITTTAQYLDRPERLLRLTSSASSLTPLSTQPVLQALSRWRPPPPTASAIEPIATAEIRRLVERPNVTLANLISAAELTFMCSQQDALVEYAELELFARLKASLAEPWAATVDLELSFFRRQSVIRGLFTAADAPDWLEVPGVGFEAMRGLAGALTHGGPTILNPLLASQFPWVFAAALGRLGSGMLVLGYGRALAYRDNLRDDDLAGVFRAELLAAGATHRVPPTPTLDVVTSLESLRWWIDQTSRLLSIALDPTLFATSGTYTPATHHGFLHALDRLFASVVRILTLTGIDHYSRRIHLFEVLDLIEGLHLGGYDQTLDADLLALQLAALEQALPAHVAMLVVPRCRKALNGLMEMQSGFVPAAVNGDDVELPKGRTKRARAVALYLRVVRNGSHGMLKEMKAVDKRRQLAMHDGSIPDEVSDIAFLHLMRLVTEPDLLQQPWLRNATS